MLSALHVSTHLIKGSCHLKSLLRIITTSDLILSPLSRPKAGSTVVPSLSGQGCGRHLKRRGTGSVLTPVSARMEVSCGLHKVHKCRETRGAVPELFKAQTRVRTPDALCSFAKAEGTRLSARIANQAAGSQPLAPPPRPRLPVAGKRRVWAQVSGLCIRAEQTAPTAARAKSPQTRLLTPVTTTGELAALWAESKPAKALPSLPWPRQNPAGLGTAPRMQGGPRQRGALPLRGSRCCSPNNEFSTES